MEIKETAHKLIDTLPDNTTWEKLVYTLQIRQDIEAGLADSEANHVMSSDEVRKKLSVNQ
ncbi:hypothetical protein JYU22_05705 [Gammaproteobacteria bacterium AH-315-E17]|nr:hypothetical protein [Gammaproteobacteria bacterium AH-315-E17]